MIISVQAKRRNANGDLLVTVLNGQGDTDDWRLSPKDAEQVERVWAQTQFDLERYAKMPAEFPFPVAVPVEIDDDQLPALV